MMSTDDEAAGNMMMFCASCGIAENDDVKLKKCACNLVRYCSVTCQRDHRSQHKKACKKRVAELRDELLFTQPESSHLGDCQICFLPLSIDLRKSALMSCCSKTVCCGCEMASILHQTVNSGNPETKCPFCRKPPPCDLNGEVELNTMKRIEANDPAATRQKGMKCYNKGEYESAFKYLTKAAELGDYEAHYHLSRMYRDGRGVEQDSKKEKYHLEEAAIGGHPSARYTLGLYEARQFRFDRATKHWIISANLGCDESMDMIREFYSKGAASKEDFAAALRAHQASVDATKSPQRERADEVNRMTNR